MDRSKAVYIILLIACLIMLPILYQKYNGDIFYCVFPFVGAMSSALSLLIK